MTLSSFLPVLVLALVAIGIAIAAMAIGVMFKRPCLRGSCGGPTAVAPDGTKLSCETCPNRKRGTAAASVSVRIEP